MTYEGYVDKDQRKEYLKLYMRLYRKQQKEASPTLKDLLVECATLSRKCDLEMQRQGDFPSQKKVVISSPLTPFYRDVAVEVFEKFRTLWTDFSQVEAYVHDFVSYDLEQLKNVRETFYKLYGQFELIEVYKSFSKARDVVYQSDLRGRVCEDQKSQEQYWTDIMLFLKSKGFDYFTAREVADSVAYLKESDTGQYYVRINPHSHIKTYTVNTGFNTEINEWEKQEKNTIEHKKALMKINQLETQKNELFFNTYKDVVSELVKEDCTTKQVKDYCYRLQIPSNVRDDLILYAEELRKSMPKKLVITAKTERTETAKPDPELTKKFDEYVQNLIAAGLTDDEIILRGRQTKYLDVFSGDSGDLWKGRLRLLRQQFYKNPFILSEQEKAKYGVASRIPKESEQHG